MAKVDFSFNLPTEHLVRVRFDSVSKNTLDLFKEHILDFYQIRECILSREVASKTEKVHYHTVFYFHKTMKALRLRLKSHVNLTASAGVVATSNNWNTVTKHKDFKGIMAIANINYAHFHVYYICKDKDILINTLNPFLDLDGYEKILGLLPETVQTIRAKAKVKGKNPNLLMVLIKKYKKQRFLQNSPLVYQEKMQNILDFVISEFRSINTSDDEHLGKMCNDHILVNFTQTIYNIFHLDKNSQKYEEILTRCLS